MSKNLVYDRTISSFAYNHRLIEKKWQGVWEKEGIYFPDINKSSNKYYNLWMFPYPSAEGLHAGHAFASTGSDIYGRFARMNGKNVFQPIGYDSFGIHSENYAIKINEDPHEVVRRTTKHYEGQMRSLGHGYDWTKTVTTSDPDYYRWTQWLFIKMWEKGLAYRKKAEVNFCPSCKTVLADEQVINGDCERCQSVVGKKDLEQWFFKITDYAERLLSGLDKINWSERVVKAQREWIGKKRGINITYDIAGQGEKVEVFTTAPVNFGMTFIVLSPEHPLINKILNGEVKVPEKSLENIKKYVSKYLAEEKNTNKYEERVKTGVFTGLYITNPVDKREIPVWISNFVLISVGTGAVQGCPGHDYNDFEFAKKYDLPIIRVIAGLDGDISPIEKKEQVIEHGMEGKFVNSDFLNGLSFEEGLQKTMDWFEARGIGKRITAYHLRDWLVSRQRYWGAPIPMIYCDKCGWVPVPEKDLPVLLPSISDYKPKGTGKGPLANHPDFYQTKCPQCGGNAKRETDVMDTFVDSSWYFLRYPSVGLNGKAFDPIITKKWLPVDLYFGGAEHSVLHLMYARFVTMVLYDLKYLDFEEPFPKFFAHGLMIKDGAKMSKSRGNVVNPDEYVVKYGADTLRLYLMFMGPMDGSPDFRDTGIEGMYRFVNRLWRLFNSHTSRVVGTDSHEVDVVNIKMYQTIRKVTEDIQEFKYNTAISGIMEYVNTLNQRGAARQNLEALAKLLAPFTPHMAEEVWHEVLGNTNSIHKSAWPEYNPKLIQEENVTVVVQINGKMRSQIMVNGQRSMIKEEMIRMAKKDQKIAKRLDGQKVKKTIFVPGKIINFVI